VLALGVMVAVASLAPRHAGAQTQPSPVLEVDRADGLAPDGDVVRVRGSGFDTRVGIYVALCVLDGVESGAPPSPCGGGVDVEGTGGASIWISDTPPPYGVGLALPYGPGGTFDVELAVSVRIGDVDCRERACGVVTRADHLRRSDRSQDVVVPVTFAGADASADGRGALPVVGLALVLAVVLVLTVRGVRRRSALPPLVLLLVAGLTLGCTAADAPDATGAGAGASAGDPAPHADVPVVPLDVRPDPVLPVTVRDAEDREVVVTDVARVVTLVAGIAEIVLALGLGDLMVAREAGATFPELAGLPVVTDGHAVVSEAVLALRPTLVLVDATTGPAEAVEQIRASGVPVVAVPEAWTLADVAPRIRAVAAALGVAEAGERLVARTEAELDAAVGLLPPSDPPLRIAFLYLRGSAGIQLLGGPGSGADALAERLGAVDAGVAIGLDRAYTPITSEVLIAARPDVIVVMRSGLASVGGVDGLVTLPGVAQTPAGRARRVVAVDDALLLSFGPRTGQVLTILADGIADALDDTAVR
jgi:iron complex transport system substrate-binding protein